MYMNSDRIGQLATQHHGEMLADARRRQLRQQARPAVGQVDQLVARWMPDCLVLRVSTCRTDG